MEITANDVQVILDDANVLFTDIAVTSSVPCILYRSGSGLITLRGITSGNQCRARFRVFFGANVAIPSGGTVGTITIAPALNGEAVATSQMMVTPAAVSEYFNIASSVYLDIASGCCAQLSIKNLTGNTIEMQNANLIVERVA